MKFTTIAVDLSKSVFQLSLADNKYRIVARRRLSRAQFLRFLASTEAARLVMEACSTAHYWSRIAIHVSAGLILPISAEVKIPSY